MNRLLIATTLSASIMLTACSQTNAFDFFSSDTYYEKAVSNMEKVSLMRDMETKALVHAVYLNNVDPHIYFGDEYFYVALHIIEDAYDPKKHGLKNLDYRLRMIDEQKQKTQDDITKAPEYRGVESLQEEKKQPESVYVDPIEAIELDEDHKLRRTMPIRNQWNHYYLVRYKEVNASTLRLSFENDQYGKAQLTFQKEK